MKKRSGRTGKGRIEVDHMPDKVHVYNLASMDEAVARYRQGSDLLMQCKPGREEPPDISKEMIQGDSQLTKILDHAEELMEAAILEDPRLAKRPGWVRSEEGIDACCALLAAGEDRPCFSRVKLGVQDQATCEPVKIVISTDGKEIKPENASAFIATAKLAQQFRPLEVWWQGAWLEEREGEHYGKGHIFLVPLIQGDMDFARLQFVLSDTNRDRTSYRIMFSYAYPASIGWGGGVGEDSYLPDTFDFVRETGMSADPFYISRYAARWAGLEAHYRTVINEEAALQRWDPVGPRRYEATAEDRRRWDRESNDRKRATIDKAKSRQSEVH